MRRRASVPRDTGSAVGKPRDPSASIVTYLLPTQTSAWTGARVPARRSAKTLLSVLALLFFSPPPPPFLFLPLRPRLTLFCSLPFSPVCCSSSFSHLTPLPPLLAAVTCSTRPPLPSLPRQEGLVSHFSSPSLKRFGGLAFFQVFFSSI